jgi:hypothetical protein
MPHFDYIRVSTTHMLVGTRSQIVLQIILPTMRHKPCRNPQVAAFDWQFFENSIQRVEKHWLL